MAVLISKEEYEKFRKNVAETDYEQFVKDYEESAAADAEQDIETEDVEYISQVSEYLDY